MSPRCGGVGGNLVWPRIPPGSKIAGFRTGERRVRRPAVRGKSSQATQAFSCFSRYAMRACFVPTYGDAMSSEADRPEFPFYPKAPVAERVIGLEFASDPSLAESPLSPLAMFHLEHLADWTIEREQMALEPISSYIKDGPFRTRRQLKPMPNPDFRFAYKSRDGRQLIQIQRNRFFLNCLNLPNDGPGDYVRFEKLLPEFLSHWASFAELLKDQLGWVLTPTHWELIYVNKLEQGGQWGSPGEWSELFPNVCTDPLSEPDFRMTTGSASRRYRIERQAAEFPGTYFLLDASHLPAEGDSKECLFVRSTAMGIVPPERSPFDCFGYGNSIINRVFGRIASDNAKEAWRDTP